jgi:hypothetical protein
MWHKDCIPAELPPFCQHTRHNILSLETVTKFLFIHALLQIQCSDFVFLFFFSLMLYIRKLKILLNEVACCSPIKEVVVSQCRPQHQVIEGGCSVVMEHTNNAGKTWQPGLRVSCGHLRCWRSAAVDSTVTLPWVAQWEFAIRIRLFTKRNTKTTTLIIYVIHTVHVLTWMYHPTSVICHLWHQLHVLAPWCHPQRESLQERYTRQPTCQFGSAPLRNDRNLKMLNYRIIILSIEICNMLLLLPVLSCFDTCGGWIQTSVLVPYDVCCTAWCRTLCRAYLGEILSDHMELSPMFLYIIHIYENN